MASLASAGFRSHSPDAVRRRADENDPGILTRLRELGVLAQESVARMDGIGAVVARRLEDFLDSEIAFSGGRGSDVSRLIRHSHVERGAVDIRIDRDAGDAGFTERANDSDGDLAAIGHEDFAEAHLFDHLHLNRFPRVLTQFDGGALGFYPLQVLGILDSRCILTGSKCQKSVLSRRQIAQGEPAALVGQRSFE